jgi:hypothetical protein
LLARIRRSAPAVTVQAPPRSWNEALADAATAAGEWLARRQSESRFYVEVPEARLTLLRDHRPRQVRMTLDAAERVLRHEFDLLGSGPYTPVDPDRPVDAGGYRPIDWYLDPIAGLRFPRAVPLAEWSLERMRPGRADIKLPWELGRCQHWPLLGQAYRLTHDDRFATEIVRELDDFIDANPIGTAVNWACTMDVGLRAANWALAFELVRPCASLGTAFWSRAYEALFDHGVFIERHLENTYEVTSNHFLSNVVGLFFVAAACRDLPQGEAWDRQCRAWLEQEMGVQVLPDGADFESSIPYHRLVTELFLGSARLAAWHGRPLPEAMLSRLRQMVDVLAAVMRPDGLMPQVGDADDGRLHVLSGYGTWKPQDARHLFGPAGCLLETDRWAGLADEWTAWESAWWGFEPAEIAQRVTPDSVAIDGDGIRHLPDAGLAVIRRRRDYLLVTNGKVGTNGFGNHKHNDLLGFEYHRDGAAVLVDPGSYVYTSDPDARNLMRSTRSHNTAAIDGEEQNEIRPEWLFRTFEKATPEDLRIEERADAFEYRGRHRGYTRLAQPVIHERRFVLEKASGALTIVDRLEGRGRHVLRWHFHFAPGVHVSLREPGVYDIGTAAGTLTLRAPAALRPAISDTWYSPSYGVRHRSVALDLDAADSIDGSREYTFQIAP